ncbi:hypothetical protein [Leptospira terpstrae]|uniref:Uncharacterized protein n=1 Tax=Leptospira terpstrae serovar Hualin str. LT 11-33 = ATCC 700639 TaxID=1257025 RepID=N1VNK0_9LEPT|nr:hypothetical protein [Leptospira terpstrae]EMY61259.1 hypothetical protein LEP1GSC203_1124 [Leptospira terpstrae serovar Hualin str. LT 11-33 = ATCC 700639]
MIREPQKPASEKTNVVNLAIYRAKKALERDGFEVVENPDGKITLVIRLAK